MCSWLLASRCYQLVPIDTGRWDCKDRGLSWISTSIWPRWSIEWSHYYCCRNCSCWPYTYEQCTSVTWRLEFTYLKTSVSGPKCRRDCKQRQFVDSFPAFSESADSRHYPWPNGFWIHDRRQCAWSEGQAAARSATLPWPHGGWPACWNQQHNCAWLEALERCGNSAEMSRRRDGFVSCSARWSVVLCLVMMFHFLLFFLWLV